MVVGDADAAPVVRARTIHETKKDGTVVNKKIWEPLYAPTPNVPNASDIPAFSDQMDTPPSFFEPVDNTSAPSGRSQTNSVSIHI
jgi:hypothetical protein